LPPRAIDAGSSVNLLFHDVFMSDPAESGFQSPAADRYKLTVVQFEQHLAGLAALHSPALPFSLTFDDGGESYYSQIADRLERLNWRAHCFVPTDFIDRPGFMTRRQIRELDRRGHHIGAHSASHPSRMSACSDAVLRNEWSESVGVLQDILGRAVRVASVPGGSYSTAVAEAAAAAGINTLFTSEPVTHPSLAGDCAIVGRFAIRQYNSPTLSARLVRTAPWTRWAMWLDWNTKALCKPILGPAYMRVADWVMARKATTRNAN
jgi:peptidoglycan/xylan/chitin deacetylase (PgdA/CDA1 family)